MTATGTRHQGPPMKWAERSRPKSWRVCRLKDVVLINQASLPETTDPDATFGYVDIGSVDADGRIRRTEELAFGSAPSRARRLVRNGDSIVSTVRTYLKAIAHIGEGADNLVVSTGFATLTPRPGLHPRFLYWWLRGSAFVEEIVARSVGVSYPAVNASDVADAMILVPALEEQRRIGEFLDSETGRIDELISEQLYLLELLTERQRLWRRRYVTVGCEPQSVVVHDSEWFGEVNADWRVVPLRWSILVGSGEATPLAPEPSEEYPVPGWGGNGLVGWAPDSNHQAGGLVIGRVGQYCGNVRLVSEPVWVTDNALRVKVDRDFLPAFLAVSLAVRDLNSLANRSAQPLVTGSQVKQQRIPCPPIDTQRRILRLLEQQERVEGDVREGVEAQIALLREHRQALITAAVTGGLDAVRKVA